MSENLPPADDERFDLEREPLDRPPPGWRDWGGDGSDLNRPVRAHVLAALEPTTEPYPPPVGALRELGDPREAGVDERRKAIGLTQEHLADLVRMARDRDLYTSDGDTNQVWGPLHAFQSLGDLDASTVVSELIPLLDLEDDWFDTTLPELLGKIGAPAIEPIRAYLADHSRWYYGQSAACRALEEIAKQHPDLREQVVGMLEDILRDAENYDEVVATAAMDALVELEEVEALPLIRRAFEIGKIDEMLRGGWGDVLQDFDIEPDEDDPLVAESQRRFEERNEALFPRAQREELQQALARFSERTSSSTALDSTAPIARSAHHAAQQKARKQKNKRKASSASRKANRRKHK